MLDLLAAIVSADPPALLAWLVLAFAAGMYPVGIMLGSSCSPCCDPCVCSQGQLPETVTLSLTGFNDGNTPGFPLCFLSFSSNYGSGASGRVTAPVGSPGPATSVVVLNGGSGYARIARVSPSISASATGGTGAAFSVSLNQTTYEDRPAWEVASLSITNGGTGYPANGYLTFSTATGDTTQQSAEAMFYSGRVAPTVAASASGSGSGAVLSVSLASDVGWDGRTYWYVDGISITNGGTGYAEFDPVAVTVTDGEGYGAYSEVSSVDEDGAITGIAVYWGGEYFKSSGIIESVEVISAGLYYKDDPALPGEKASVTVAAVQMGEAAATASGATFSVTIDDVTSSPTFGQITAVNIQNGGTGYLAAEWCEAYLNGTQVVLSRAAGTCVWQKQDCGRQFSVAYRGPSLPALVTVANDCASYSLEASSLIDNCSSISFTANDSGQRSASVTGGGTFSTKTCGDCTGSVSVGGVNVPIGTGEYVLVCAHAYPDYDQCESGGFVKQTVAAYAYATASAVCSASSGFFDEDYPYLASETKQIIVKVNVTVNGITAFSCGSPREAYIASLEADGFLAQYASASLGSKRSSNGEFLPYNYAMLTVELWYSLGPVKGSQCAGSKWTLLNPKHMFWDSPELTTGLTDCHDLISTDNTGTRTGTIQCGPT